ncbi:MAG: hypothetical protein RLZZ591_1845 [Pseudomonadota bacterium]|jgi:phosphohistidine phosphatase
MDLVLWRHAQAVDASPGCDDLARTLTAKGEKQAERMAEWLDRQLPQGARVLVSPAARTVQTAAALARPYRLAPELAPDRTVDELLQAARWPAGNRTVLLVGHQPTLGRTVAHLLGLRETECTIKRGAVWWLRQRERDGQLQTLLLSVQSPDML